MAMPLAIAVAGDPGKKHAEHEEHDQNADEVDALEAPQVGGHDCDTAGADDGVDEREGDWEQAAFG